MHKNRQSIQKIHTVRKKVGKVSLFESGSPVAAKEIRG
jgi:hypothetical protein